MKKIIAYVLNTGLGNLVMITPLFHKIKNKYPKSHLTVAVSNKSSADILKNNPHIDNVIIVKKNNFYLEKFLPLSGFFQLLKIRKSNFDRSYTCSPYAIYAKLCSIIIGAKERKINKSSIQKTHRSYENCDLINGEDRDKYKKEIYILDCEKKSKIEKSVGIHVGCDANAPNKRWPIEKFIELSNNLTKENYKTIFFIGPDEVEFKKEIVDSSKGVIFENGNFREVIKKIAQCEYFISNDSGLAHIAEALNIPLVALFGPTDHKMTGPLPNYKKVEVIIPKDDSNYIKKISVKEVYSAFNNLTKENNK